MNTTKLQRALLWHFIEHGGKSLIQTGRKSTSWGTRAGGNGEALIRCSECVWWGLRTKKLIEEDPQASGPFKQISFRITEAGRLAAGKKKPEIRAHFTGGSHGPRWI